MKTKRNDDDVEEGINNEDEIKGNCKLYLNNQNWNNKKIDFSYECKFEKNENIKFKLFTCFLVVIINFFKFVKF